MPDVLDHQDIAALLDAVTSGEVGEEEQGPQIFSRFRKDLESVEIKEYDFKRPERISKDQMRAFQTLHENFARNFGASLSGFLRAIVEVRVVHAEQCTYAEFISSLPNPTSFNLLTAEPLDGQMCLEVSPLIIYPIIDRLLGGTSQELFIPQRPMTLIESRLVHQLLERATTAMKEAWADIDELDFKLGEMESNPHIVQIVPPNEVVVVLGFEIKMTNRAGTMSLCVPFAVIEPLMEKFNTQNWFTSGKQKEDHVWSDLIADRLSHAGIEIAGVLAETTMTMSDLRGLEVGDVITTEKSASSPVVLHVEGRPKFFANIGHFKGRRALKISRALQAGDRV